MARLEQRQRRRQLSALQQAAEQRQLRLCILAALCVKPRQRRHLADPCHGGLGALATSHRRACRDPQKKPLADCGPVACREGFRGFRLLPDELHFGHGTIFCWEKKKAGVSWSITTAF